MSLFQALHTLFPWWEGLYDRTMPLFQALHTLFPCWEGLYDRTMPLFQALHTLFPCWEGLIWPHHAPISGTAYIIPVLGGFVADAFAGKYNTILGAGLIYTLGKGKHFSET